MEDVIVLSPQTINESCTFTKRDMYSTKQAKGSPDSVSLRSFSESSHRDASMGLIYGISLALFSDCTLMLIFCVLMPKSDIFLIPFWPFHLYMV